MPPPMLPESQPPRPPPIKAADFKPQARRPPSGAGEETATACSARSAPADPTQTQPHPPAYPRKASSTHPPKRSPFLHQPKASAPFPDAPTIPNPHCPSPNRSLPSPPENSRPVPRRTTGHSPSCAWSAEMHPRHSDTHQCARRHSHRSILPRTRCQSR